ncbi:MAG: ABC transporter permease subunit [Burkholderiaceae bacterium]
MTSTLRTTWVVFTRELASYFSTPVGAIFLLVFLALSAGMTFFLGGFFERAQADLTTFFTWHPWLFLILMPAIGMRLWAEERRSGTIELLMTLPVSTSSLVLGKFLAAWGFAAIALLLTFPLWVTVNYLGSPDNGVIVASYLGSWLMAGAFLAVAALISVFTKNQVIAFIVAALVSFVLVMLGSELVLSTLRGWLPDAVVQWFSSMSFISHFGRLTRGVLDAGTLFFFGSLIVLCLWLNTQVLEWKRAN